MYICICNALTESDVKQIINVNEIVSIPELKKYNICDNCKTCFESVREILIDCVDERYKDNEWYISPKEGCHWTLE